MSHWQYYGFPDPTLVPCGWALEGLYKALMERRSVFRTFEENLRYKSLILSEVSDDVSWQDILDTNYVTVLSTAFTDGSLGHWNLLYRFDYLLSLVAQYYYNDEKNEFWDFFSLCRETAVEGDIVIEKNMGGYNVFSSYSSVNRARYSNIIRFSPAFNVRWLKHRYRMLNKLNSIRFINPYATYRDIYSFSSHNGERVEADNDFWDSFTVSGEGGLGENRSGSYIRTDYRGGDSSMYVYGQRLETRKMLLSTLVDWDGTGWSYYPISADRTAFRVFAGNSVDDYTLEAGLEPSLITNRDFIVHYKVEKQYYWASGPYAPYRVYADFDDFGAGLSEGDEGILPMDENGETYHRAGNWPTGGLSLGGHYRGFRIEISEVEIAKRFSFYFQD